MFVPLELLEKCKGSLLHVELKTGEMELTGTLMMFDEACNMLLKDVVYYRRDPITASITEISKVPRVLLNSQHIGLMIPGGIGAAQ